MLLAQSQKKTDLSHQRAASAAERRAATGGADITKESTLCYFHFSHSFCRTNRLLYTGNILFDSSVLYEYPEGHFYSFSFL